MPASVALSHSSRPEDLIGRLNSAQAPYEAKLSTEGLEEPDNWKSYQKACVLEGRRGYREPCMRIGCWSESLCWMPGLFPYYSLLFPIQMRNARSLKMIYQSNVVKVAPDYDALREENMEYLLSLLNRDNGNVTSLGASIITHSCRTVEQQALSEAGVIKRLVGLLGGSLL